ncbi:hypothetical protein FA13DRAFT_1800788 [Coprinellus micaceus]|uniref:Uncharacterized protein n=1 Tax=Coprinellus micaceus TaxID=71717 RepID=A0A4Y7SFC1_COPMI|nr:hypothetical protein FA13DRAFT_1800788 [Coprinellus micaceus]
MPIVVRYEPSSPIVPTSEPTEVELSPPPPKTPWMESQNLDGAMLGSLDDGKPLPECDNSQNAMALTRKDDPIDYHHLATPTKHSTRRHQRSYSPPHKDPPLESYPCQHYPPITFSQFMKPGPFSRRSQSPTASNSLEQNVQVAEDPFKAGDSQDVTAAHTHRSLKRMRRSDVARPTPQITTTAPLTFVSPADRHHALFQLELIDIDVAALAFKRRRLLELLGDSAA